MALKDNIKRLRKLKELSVEQLAQKVNVSKQHVYNWEAGTFDPTNKSMGKLASALGTTISELLGESKVDTSKGIYEKMFESILKATEIERNELATNQKTEVEQMNQKYELLVEGLENQIQELRKENKALKKELLRQKSAKS